MQYQRWKRAFEALLDINETEAHERMADGCDRWAGYFVLGLEPSSQYRAAEFSGAAIGHQFRALEIGYDARGGMTESHAACGACAEARCTGGVWSEHTCGIYDARLTIEVLPR